jgi:hypothetical protein
MVERNAGVQLADWLLDDAGGEAEIVALPRRAAAPVDVAPRRAA